MTIPPRLGAASSSRRAKPNSKSAAIAKPVKTPPNAAAWMQTKRELKRRVAGGYSKFGAFCTPDRPPANAMKKNSGNRTLGSRIAGFVKALWMPRQATASATERVRASVLMSAPASFAGRAR